MLTAFCGLHCENSDENMKKTVNGRNQRKEAEKMNILKSLPNPEDLIGKEICIHGTAMNAKAGAVVILEDEQILYILDLPEWDDEVLGKPIIVEGILDKKQIYPEAEVDESGAVSQGMSGKPFVIKMSKHSFTNEKYDYD